MSEDVSREEIQSIEGDFLSALVAERSNPETCDFPIKRRGKIIGKFSIRALFEHEINTCREEATEYKTNSMGIRVPKSHDTTRYRNLLIYMATVGEKGKKVWDRPDLWQKLGVTNSADVIDVLLLAGEKDRVVDKITELSGYGDVDLEGVAKN